MPKAKVLTSQFFNRPTLTILPDILGKYIIRRSGGQFFSGYVTEAEAYVGFKDKACHAAKGKTERTKVMFEAAGTWYIYLCYGMHWMLNIVTEKRDFPAAILIRGIQNDRRHYDGPGKLTKYLKVDKKLNGRLAQQKNALWFEDRGFVVKPSDIKKGKRIGIGYAGAWQNKLWRYTL